MVALAPTIGLAAMRRHPARVPEGGGVVVGFTVVWFLGVLVPVAGLVALSFLTNRGLSFLLQPTLQAYADILQGFRLEIVLRTLRITAVVTLIELLVAFPFALWLAKGVKRGWLKLATLVLLVVPFFLSPAARTIVWRAVLGREGLINSGLIALGVADQPLDWLLFSEFAVYLGFLGPYFPSMVWPLFISISLIDDELIKASRDLGASDLDTLRFIIMPLALPGVAAGVIFTFVPMLGDNVVSTLLGGGQVSLMAEAVNDLIRVMNYATAAAVSTLVLLMIFLFQWFFWLALGQVGQVGDIFEGLRQ
jgi:ABC-type spermidine/putrescine transport system permease subunit I